jgi:hypothetical protein
MVPDVILVMLVESVHGISLQFFTEPKDKSGRTSEHFIMQDYHQLDVWNRATCPCCLRVHGQFAGAGKVQSGVTTSASSNVCAIEHTEFGRFLGFGYRSLKEVYPSLARHRTQPLIDEGNQISKMTYTPGNPLRRASDSKLRTQASKRQGLAPGLF